MRSATASEVLNYLSRQFGMTVRPNHLGMACNATAVPASSKTAISAGTCRRRRRSEQSRFATNARIRPDGGCPWGASTEEAAHFDGPFPGANGPRRNCCISMGGLRV